MDGWAITSDRRMNMVERYCKPVQKRVGHLMCLHSNTRKVSIAASVVHCASVAQHAQSGGTGNGGQGTSKARIEQDCKRVGSVEYARLR